MTVTAAEIGSWLGQFAWPWLRVSALMMVAPLFGNTLLPVRVRILLGLGLTVLVMPVVGAVPEVDLLSVEALLIAVQQVLIGGLIGFLIAVAFQAVVIAGESIALSMGLGFATMVDPQSGVAMPVLSQFLLILATLLFLSLGGHLMLLELLAESFRSMPVGVGLTRGDFMAVAAFGSRMFAGAVLIALPAVVVLLIVQLAMGVMTRAAPQMNIFSVGFPITMLLGFLTVLALVLPTLQSRLVGVWSEAFAATRTLLGG